jgi:hypothetical protein
MKLTTHAIIRFQSRIVPQLSFEEATKELQAAILKAACLKEKTATGQFLWRVDSPAMRLVTKKVQGEDLLVTVLPPQMDLWGANLELLEEMLQEREEGLRRLQQQVKNLPPDPRPVSKSEPKSEPPPTVLNYKERRGLLMLEIQILYHEQAAIKQRERALREESQEALKVAVQGLMGVMSRDVAIARLKKLSPGLLASAS